MLVRRDLNKALGSYKFEQDSSALDYSEQMDLSEKSSPIKLGSILKSLRLAKGLSQQDLALETKVSYRNYQEIEYGNTSCKMDTLAKILKVYDLNVFSFFSMFMDEEFRSNGPEFLYHVFGENSFALRRFDLEGVVTYQCPMSRIVTGLEDHEAVGIMKLWSDLSESSMERFVRLGFRALISLKPPLPSWKAQIKNHHTQVSKAYMGYGRYLNKLDGECTGLEVILFPIDGKIA